MSKLTKATVLVLNRNWQAINVRTPQEAFCMMAANVATGLEIEGEDPMEAQAESFCTPHSALRTSKVRPVTWEEWITLPVREQDEAVHTVRGQIRVPTVIVAVNYAKVPRKRPKLCARAIRERDPESFRDCQYTRRVLRPDDPRDTVTLGIENLTEDLGGVQQFDLGHEFIPHGQFMKRKEGCNRDVNRNAQLCCFGQHFQPGCRRGRFRFQHPRQVVVQMGQGCPQPHLIFVLHQQIKIASHERRPRLDPDAMARLQHQFQGLACHLEFLFQRLIGIAQERHQDSTLTPGGLHGSR